MRDPVSAQQDIDKLFKHFPDYSAFRLHQVIEESDFSIPKKMLAHENEAIENMLVNVFKYAEPNDSSNLSLKLTPLGREVKNAGGHYTILKQLEEKANDDKERQKLNDEKLKYDVKIARRIIKTYWYTVAISIAGLLLAAGKILYDISTVNK